MRVPFSNSKFTLEKVSIFYSPNRFTIHSAIRVPLVDYKTTKALHKEVSVILI